MFHCLVRQTTKLVKPRMSTARMIGVVLPHAFLRSACVSHGPSAGKEETGDLPANPV